MSNTNLLLQKLRDIRVLRSSCSNPRCEVRFKMVLGIFYGDNVFCTSDCLKEWEKKK